MRSGCMSRRHSRRLSRWPRRGGGPCGGGEGAAAQAARDAAARAARERHEKIVRRPCVSYSLTSRQKWPIDRARTGARRGGETKDSSYAARKIDSSQCSKLTVRSAVGCDGTTGCGHRRCAPGPRFEGRRAACATAGGPHLG